MISRMVIGYEVNKVVPGSEGYGDIDGIIGRNAAEGCRTGSEIGLLDDERIHWPNEFQADHASLGNKECLDRDEGRSPVVTLAWIEDFRADDNLFAVFLVGAVI